MKKYLLLASAAAFVFAANAQDKSKAVYRDATSKARIDQESNNAPIKQDVIPSEKAASTIAIGTSYNVFTILGDRQNQVVYNPAINTVGFVHRQNDGGAGGSGVISFDYSTDGGANWTINPFQLTPNLGGGNGNRYPNITLYNPPANTDPANAYVVVTGPQLQTGASSGANGWGGTFRASSQFASNALLDEQYFQLSTDAAGDNNEWGAAGLYANPNGEVWDATTNIDNAQTNLVADNYSNYFINKGVYNATNMNFDWTSQTITPGWNTTMNFTTSTLTNVGGLPNMAWSPDGMTGYMVAMGAVGANTMYRPYVMKTTDGGANWSNVMDYDFSQNAVLQSYIWPLNTNPAVQRPFFSSYDMVVDNSGELRIFAEVASGFSDHPDSLNYTFAARQSGFLFEVATNGANWDVTFVDSVLVDDYEWDVTNGLSHFVRPQAARSQDGSKVFYTWIGSDPLLSTFREFPAVWAIGHDLSGSYPQAWTSIKNLSVGNNSDYVAAYQTVAVDAIENGLDQTWELPIVYGTAMGGSSLTDGLVAPQWNFLRGVGFSPIDFGVISVEENTLTENSVSIYPNPTNGVIAIQIANAKDFNYNVIDVVGNVIASNHVNGNKTVIDLTNNAKGVYFVSIKTENGAITKKVMLTK